MHGANNESEPGGESSLDIQYIMGVGAGVPSTFWSVSGPVGDGGYILAWALQVGNTTDPPLVTSIRLACVPPVCDFCGASECCVYVQLR